MKKLAYFAIILVACTVLASCLHSDDYDYTYTEDAAITAFSLGTLNRYTNSISSSTGNDTVLSSTVTGSNYKFYIDQEKNLIYNPDSLPYGTDPEKVVCSISSYNSASVSIKSLTSDTLTTFSSSDSIDFTEPREFHAFSITGSSVRVYEVHVNIHQQQDSIFVWKQLAQGTPMGSLTGMKGVMAGGYLYIMGSDGASARLYRSGKDGAEWQELSLPESIDSDAWQSFCTFNDTMLAGSQGKFYYSTDGLSWTEMAGTEGKRLLGASSRSIFVMAGEGEIQKTSDWGASWTTLTLDGEEASLPTQDISMLVRDIKSTPTAEQVLMAGNRSLADYPSDSTSLLWGYAEETDDMAEAQPFSHYEWTIGAYYNLPRIADMQCAASGQSFYAIGSGGMGNVSLDAFATIFRSDDGGVTWYQNYEVAPPDNLSIQGSSFAFFGDSDNFLWLICGGSGDVWRGRLNKLGWPEVQTSFTE